MGERLSRLAPTVGYIIAQFIFVGYWGYIIRKYGFDPPSPEPTAPVGAFIVMVILTGPPAAVLGVIDASAQRSRHSLVRMLDAFLIVAFAVLWMNPLTEIMLSLNPDIFGNVDTAPWQTCLGFFIGQEFSLALVVILSVGIRWVARRRLRRDT